MVGAGDILDSAGDARSPFDLVSEMKPKKLINEGIRARTRTSFCAVANDSRLARSNEHDLENWERPEYKS